MTVVPCEVCGQQVARMFQARTGPNLGRWRIIRHKTQTQPGPYLWNNWCPGRYERREETRR